MSEETDDFLAHHGVMGMKWGKRHGGLKSRVKGAALDSIQRRQVVNKNIAGGTANLRDYARASAQTKLGVYTAGSKKGAAKRVVKLEARKQRIESGKIKVRDVLDFAGHVSLADLAVSRTDKRG